MSSSSRLFTVTTGRQILNKINNTGLPTKDETSEKTEQNLCRLYFWFPPALNLFLLMLNHLTEQLKTNFSAKYQIQSSNCYIL